MCGIAGFLDTTLRNSSEHLRATARRMGDTLQHRGPDDAGIWADSAAGIALAHRRLSILDLSSAGHQPMLSTSGRYVIVFNGEIYNHLGLRRELETAHFHPHPQRGREISLGRGGNVAWRGHSDTETLLAGFEAWGLKATLKKTVGMFAIALWDRAERTLTLARDRLGEKPVYYGRQGNVFLFGSELKALKAHPAFHGEIDRNALALFLRHSCIPAPYSIYRDIYKLPAGTYLQIN